MPIARQSEIPAPIRPKTIGRTSGTFARKPAHEARDAERIRRERLMATVFGALLDAEGISNVRAGEWLGGESVVRRLLSRERPITAYHLAQMPPDFAHALLVGFRQVLCTNAANDVSNDLAG